MTQATIPDSMEINSLLGERIASARQANGLTQDQLADLVGVKKSTLTRWESDRISPRASRLNHLAGVLGVPVTWLLAGGDGPAQFDAPSLHETARIEIKLEAAEALLEQLSTLIHEIREQARNIQDEFDQEL